MSGLPDHDGSQRANYTTGPWFVNTPRTIPEVNAADGTPICKCRNGSLNDGVANARLIAAAPDYDNAARLLMAWWDSLPRDWKTTNHDALHAAVSAARAALARADGREVERG